MIRATVSVEPPAVKGTMILMGFVGQAIAVVGIKHIDATSAMMEHALPANLQTFIWSSSFGPDRLVYPHPVFAQDFLYRLTAVAAAEHSSHQICKIGFRRKPFDA